MSIVTSGRRISPIAALAMALLPLACASHRPPIGDPLADLRPRNGAIPHGESLGFRFQRLDEPLLETLSTREQLQRIVGSETSQFEQIVQLRNWVAAQWRPGNPDPYPPWNALTVLDWIRQRRTGGHCGQYSQVFQQSLAALGFTARYVEIGSATNPYAHFITEVWSNDYDKWVVMDADYNLHFEREGIPLSALEVHDAAVRSEWREISARVGHQLSGHAKASAYRHRTAELYYYVRFHLKADHLTKPDEPPMDRLNDMVEWEDAWTTPWEHSPVKSEYPKERLTRRQTGDRTLVEPLLNQVEATAIVGPTAISVGLRNNVLEWSQYEYQTVAAGIPSGWQMQTGATLELPRAADDEVVVVRGVNVRGVRGPSAVIAIPAVR